MVISDGMMMANSLIPLRRLARLHGQSGGLHLHSIWNQISSGTGVAAVVPSKAFFSSAPKFF
jgi:hypothetical protein